MISDTISLLDLAATDVGNITTKVNDAVKKVEDGKSTKLDLTDANKATEQLKKTGEKTQEIKRRIEQARSSVTDDERKANVARKAADAVNDRLQAVA